MGAYASVQANFLLHTKHVYNNRKGAVMSKRVNIMLPESTLKILDRVAGKGDRSRFISQAVLHYVQSQTASNLRKRLKQAALVNAKLDLEIAEEWFPAEQEAWQKLDREERASKPSRAGAKSTSRRSTRQ
jgi:CopG family transcriptional regulator/antitoxin EndoAI